MALVYGALGLVLVGNRARSLAVHRSSRAAWAAGERSALRRFRRLLPLRPDAELLRPRALSQWLGPRSRVVAARRASRRRSPTSAPTCGRAPGAAPRHQRVLDGGHGLFNERYMTLFAYLATALRPDARKRASHQLRRRHRRPRRSSRHAELESIDVVDISRDMLELGTRGLPPRPAPARGSARARPRRGRPLVPPDDRLNATT